MAVDELEVVEGKPALLRRQLVPEDILCPAGEVIGDAGCYCSIEQGVVDGRTQTSSIGAFCMSGDGHKSCPTWQAEKDRIREGRKESLIAKPKMNRTPKKLRDQRLAEAKERLYSNNAEGRKFRRRLGLREEV